jgi:tetratricopeptide (TPR) repeat protein
VARTCQPIHEARRAGIAECEHALALDRNLAPAAASIGFGKILIGRAEETEAHISEALRLSPRDTAAYVWLTHAGMASNHLGGWEQAIAWCRRAVEVNRRTSQGKDLLFLRFTVDQYCSYTPPLSR